MKINLDFQGKACPLPVVETKKALAGLKKEDVLEVLVDNAIAVQNLSKLAEQKKLAVETEQKEDRLYLVTLTVTEAADLGEEAASPYMCPDMAAGNLVVVFSSDKMGEGEEKLGRILMKGFIYALTELEKLPQTILFYNSGVKLAVEGSESLGDLKLLEEQGVEILACGTCLNHYQLAEKLGVGTVTNMYAIAQKLTEAGKVIKP
ncbi:selenium metabolism protein YedF [Anaerotaenia torta]|uniref:sulfurtransferase-like selenium metabolism protein YedF n=1 Tax=Anaerotaenia torta TaxID=433293 RepID=UPI003D1F6886